jgi:hypothetical protein
LSTQIDPFPDGWPSEIGRLRNEVVAVRDKASPFFKGSPDPADADIAGRVTTLAAPYKLEENDRHPTIIRAAATVGKEIENFAPSRKYMGGDHILSALPITQMLDDILQDEISNAIRKFAHDLQNIENISDPSQAVARFIQSTNPASQEVIEQHALECKLAAGLIDCGNSFLNLYAARRTALELYAAGQVSQGWWQYLPASLRSIFSETT